MAIGTQFWDKVVLDADFSSIVPSNGYDATFNAYNEALPAHTKNIKFYRSLGCNIRGVAASLAPGVVRSPRTAYLDCTSTSYLTKAIYATDNTILAGDFTVEAWIYVDTTLTALPIISFTSPNNGTGKACIFIQNMALRFHSAFLVTDTGLTATIPSVQTWHKIAITRQGSTLKAYINNTLSGTFTFSGSYVQPTPYISIGNFPSSPGGGSSGLSDIADILVTLACKTSFDPLNNTYLRYAAQITGTITESLAITSWTVTGISPSGLTCSTVTTSSTYTLNCPSFELYTITCAPTVDNIWKASTAISLNYLICPTTPDTKPVLYKCTTAGTTSGTEPAFTSATHTDGSVVWTKVADLVDPISLGTRIPS